jgi:hypothetical protein
MILKEWNIWHVYSTYLLSDLLDLRHVARALVDSDLLRVAMTQDGEVFVKRDGKVELERVWAEPSIEPCTTVHFPANLLPYESECVFQASVMAFHEKRLFRPGAASEYLRGYLGLIGLTFKGREVLLYPQVKLYSNGVLLTQFRVLSGQHPIDIDTFISTQLNLFGFPGVAIELPPALLKLYVRAVVHGESRFSSYRYRHVLRDLNVVIDNASRSQQVGDFSFTLARFDGASFDRVKRPEDPPLSLRLVSQMIEYSVNDAIVRSRKVLGLRDVLKRRNIEGGRWGGRPAVYIVDYEGRPQSARQAIADFREPLAKIMVRTTAVPLNLDESLGKNCRAFDDYALFVNSTLTLWLVADLEALAKAYVPEALGRHFLLEKHVHAELIDYIHATHLRAEEESVKPQAELSFLRRAEHAFAELEQNVERASPYGEVVQLLKSASMALGDDQLRAVVVNNVRLRATELSEQREDRRTIFGWALTVLLGISVIPSVTDGVVKPSFTLLGLWRPSGSDWQILFYNGCSLVLVLFFGLLAYLYLLRRKPSV